MNYTIKFGKTIIPFFLEHRARKTLAIHVYPDQKIEVIAPLDASLEKIKSKVLKRAAWIIRKQIEFSRMQPILPHPLYVAGETYRFLGRQYRLKMEQAKEKAVQIKKKFIIIVSEKTLSPDQIKSIIQRWYRNQAGKIFAVRFRHCMEIVRTLGIRSAPHWTMRVMAKRWGSCTKAGKILLHPELVAAPVMCIDYVIVHELCHLLEHSHNRKYYDLLTSVMPDWEKRKVQLNETTEVRLM